MEILIIIILYWVGMYYGVLYGLPLLGMGLWFLAIAFWTALKFVAESLGWLIIRTGKGAHRSCILSARGIHLAIMFLYFLIDEKFRGPGIEDEPEEDDTESAQATPSVSAYEAALATLGLGPGFTREALNRAYKQMMVKFHPDRPGGSTSAAQELNIARDLVMDWNGWA